jgi:hypothetical protein
LLSCSAPSHRTAPHGALRSCSDSCSSSPPTSPPPPPPPPLLLLLLLLRATCDVRRALMRCGRVVWVIVRGPTRSHGPTVPGPSHTLHRGRGARPQVPAERRAAGRGGGGRGLAGGLGACGLKACGFAGLGLGACALGAAWLAGVGVWSGARRPSHQDTRRRPLLVRPGAGEWSRPREKQQQTATCQTRRAAGGPAVGFTSRVGQSSNGYPRRK